MTKDKIKEWFKELGCADNCILSKKKCAFYWQESDYYGEVDEGCYLCSKNCHTKILCYLPNFMQKIILKIMKSITFQMKESFKRICHPFKYGFWTIVNVKKFKLGMLWEEWDSYAGDGDSGWDYRWTGNRKTWKGLKWYKKFGIDDEGFVFVVPFFIAYLLVLPGTLYHIYELNEEMKYYNEHYNDYFEESDVEENK